MAKIFVTRVDPAFETQESGENSRNKLEHLGEELDDLEDVLQKRRIIPLYYGFLGLGGILLGFLGATTFLVWPDHDIIKVSFDLFVNQNQNLLYLTGSQLLV